MRPGSSAGAAQGGEALDASPSPAAKALVNPSRSATVTVSAEWPLRRSGDGTFSAKWMHTRRTPGEGQRGRRRGPARPRRGAGQPHRACAGVTDDGEQVIQVRERHRADRRLPVTTAVVGHHRQLRCQQPGHLRPSPPVCDALMQQQHRLAATRPPFPRQGGAVPADVKAFRHSPMLAVVLARRQINSVGPSSPASSPASSAGLVRLSVAHDPRPRPAVTCAVTVRTGVRPASAGLDVLRRSSWPSGRTSREEPLSYRALVTGPAAAWTATRPTSSPPTSRAPPGNPRGLGTLPPGDAHGSQAAARGCNRSRMAAQS